MDGDAPTSSRAHPRGEEDHADRVETQLELIRQIGEAHYLAQQIKS
jgi:bacterioferritin (cytochrome b1)